MFRQITIGAAAVFTAGLVAVGCGSDGDTIVTGGNSDITNTDPFGGATSIASNNLAPDGGGMSPDAEQVTDFRIIWNEDVGESEGPSNADNSAVLLFNTLDVAAIGGGGFTPPFASNTYFTSYQGGAFTPPVRMEANNHENSSFDILSAVALPLQTAAYLNSGVTTGDLVNNVRSNNGTWIIVMAGFTSATDPRNTDTIAGLVGRHRTIWSWVYDSSRRNVASVTIDGVTNRIGGLPAVSPRNGVYSYGLQANAGNPIPAIVGNGPITGGSTVPSSDVQSFGLLSDGFSREYRYTGQNPTIGTIGGDALDLSGAGLNPPVPPSVTPTPGSSTSTYQAGENVNLCHLVFTQIVTSLQAGQGINGVNGDQRGSVNRAFGAGLNLATLTFDTITAITPPVSQTSNLVATGVGFNDDFMGYNEYGFMSYHDRTTDNTTLTTTPYAVTNDEVIALKLVARQNAAGSSELTAIQDLAAFGGASHTVFSRTIAAQTNPVIAQENEFQAFWPGESIFGRDHGLTDTVLFYAGTDGTVNGGLDDTGSNTGNTDFALLAALFTQVNPTESSGSATSGVTVTPGGIRAVSTHVADAFTTVALLTGFGGESDFSDAVDQARFTINRDGRYIVASYLQRSGQRSTSTYASRRQLKAIAYQTNRTAATTTFVSRFSTPETVVSQTGNTVARASGDVNSNNNDSLPVNAYDVQGSVGYRCGFQSDSNVVWMTWEQSDTTEDRLFNRPLTITTTAGGTPTVAAGGIVELDTTAGTAGSGTAGQQVSGNDVDVDDTGTGTVTDDQFNFLEGDLAASNLAASTGFGGPDLTLDGVETCDLGTISTTGSTGTAGGLLVVFRKVTDATQPFFQSTTLSNIANDTDGLDQDIFAAAMVPSVSGAIFARVQVDGGVNEDLNTTTASNVAAFNPNSGLLATGRDVFEVIPVAAAGSGATADGSRSVDAVYLYWTESLNRNNGNTGPGTQNDALWTRKLDVVGALRNLAAAPTVADFSAAFRPALLANGGVDSTTAPTRLDHLQGGDVQRLIPGTPATSATGVFLLFREDGHDWGQASVDGVNYLYSGGAPNPSLIDNDTTANLGVPPITITPGLTFPDSRVDTCENDNCFLVDGIWGTAKLDRTFDNRLILRTRMGQ